MNDTAHTAALLRSKLQQAAHLFRLGELEGARALCEEVLKAQPKHYTTLNLLGSITLRAGDAKRALVLFAKAIALDPEAVPAYNNRSLALLELGDLPAALASLDSAIRLDPTDADAHLNRGNVLRAMWQLQPALDSYQRALAQRPHFIEAHTNLGVTLVQLARYAEARASFDRAIALKSDHAPALFNRGLLRLLLGDFEGGWADYEWRFRLGPTGPGPATAAPRWSGKEPLAGRRILLLGEQGFGDTLQFSRYIAVLAALGAEIILDVQPTLAGLLRGLPGVVGVRDGAPVQVDCQCPLMSLPLALGTSSSTIPASVPYLRAEPARVARWRERLGGARIGLAWSGRPTHWNDRNRSVPLSQWLTQLPSGFSYVSLQKDLREADRKTLRGAGRILDVSRELHDFSDTAALCECLDLIITVDSSVAHLAGALGRPTWILLPFNPDWRWLLERSDSPWYPTVRLYRQRTMGEWAEPLRRIAEDLLAAGLAAP